MERVWDCLFFIILQRRFYWNWSVSYKRFYNKCTQLKILQQINMQQLTTLQGISLQDLDVAPFDKDILKGVDLELYPPNRVHYLVNALVNKTKVPSEKAMIRSERKNLKRSGADKADQATGRAPRVRARARRSFNVPNRYGAKRDKNRNRRARLDRGNDLSLGSASISASPLPSISQSLSRVDSLSGLSSSQQQGSVQPESLSRMSSQQESSVQPSISAEKMEVQRQQEAEKIKKLPAEIVHKRKLCVPEKVLSTAFKTRSPEWNVLKAYKQCAFQLIEKHREAEKKDKEPIISEVLKEPLPLYFQKKKANQKRRRQEKHELIKKNRKALVQIFGNAVFRSGWPISRKEIKLALGIEETSNAVEQLGDFMKMAEEKEVEKMDVQIQHSAEIPIANLKLSEQP